MATFGEVRFAIAKLYPGLDPDVLDGFVLDGYQAILDRLSWQRTEVKTSIAIPDEYNTGTVAVTKGSATITGTGTTWTSLMTGRMIRFAGQDAWYGFTYISATSGTLDRVYEGTTASSTSHRINQNVVQLPADCRGVEAVNAWATDLDKVGRERFLASRNLYGNPRQWSLYMDSVTSPPNMQIELFPVPAAAVGLIVTYTAEYGQSSVDSAVSLLPWTRPAALKAYVQAEIRKIPAFQDLTAAQVHEATYEKRIAEMIQAEAERVGPTQIQMADRFTRHRNRRNR